ncbi:hypothetical protein [Bacteroides sp. AM10-21B]|nr:hypothetical protein [Bacteroides sp. AM10-21B]
MVGTASTNEWYDKYQPVVRQIPKGGTANTKGWYGKYQSVGTRCTKG